MTNWEIKGREFGNCNCSYGCPCQFNALPTHGHCRGLAVFDIEEGFHGTTRLDGLRAAGDLSLAGTDSPGLLEGVHVSSTAPRRTQRRPAPPGCAPSRWATLPSREPRRWRFFGIGDRMSRSSPTSTPSSISTAARPAPHRRRPRDPRRTDPQPKASAAITVGDRTERPDGSNQIAQQSAWLVEDEEACQLRTLHVDSTARSPVSHLCEAGTGGVDGRDCSGGRLCSRRSQARRCNRPRGPHCALATPCPRSSRCWEPRAPAPASHLPCPSAPCPQPRRRKAGSGIGPDRLIAFCMWTVMMVAMMLPAASPMVLLYGRVVRQSERKGQLRNAAACIAAFAAGYLSLWIFSAPSP